MPDGTIIREGDSSEVAGIVKRVEDNVTERQQVSLDVKDLRASVDKLTTGMAVMATKLDNVVSSIDKSANHSAQLAALEARVSGLSQLVFYIMGVGGSAIIGLTIAVVSAWMKK